MSRRYPTVILREMLDFSREAVFFTQGRTRGDLDTDRMFELAILRLVHMIGEAASRMPRESRLDYPTIPWNGVIGMRQHVVHGYDAINYDRVWETLQRNIPDLVVLLEAVLRDEGV